LLVPRFVRCWQTSPKESDPSARVLPSVTNRETTRHLRGRTLPHSPTAATSRHCVCLIVAQLPLCECPLTLWTARGPSSQPWENEIAPRDGTSTAWNAFQPPVPQHKLTTAGAGRAAGRVEPFTGCNSRSELNENQRI
jgi:hypothetical protein